MEPQKRELICSIKGYVKQQALMELKHILSSHHQTAPLYVPWKQYRAKIHYVQDNESELLDKTQICYFQRAIKKCLYYAHVINDTMIHTLNDIGSTAAKGTTAIKCAVQHLTDYSHSNPNTKIISQDSDMILQTNSDTVYLVIR